MTLRMLVPFDGSPAALRAVELVAGYAGDPAQLSAALLNVQSRPVSLWPGAGIDPVALDAALIEAGRQALQPARARLAGTRGAGLLHGYALGSVALRVAHGAASPVVLVKPADRLPAALGKRVRVLLAMDGSAPALRAAEKLVAWRGWLGELEVHMLYAQRPLTMLEAVLPPHDDVIGQWSTQEGRERTQAAREMFRQAGISQHMHLTVGDPALELRTLAVQTAADLVVLGTRGLGAAHHALIGSVALKAAVLCELPVMLVP